jgi:lipopolysaccharide export system protein LptA
MARLFSSLTRFCCLTAAICLLLVSPLAAADAPIQIEADKMSSTEKTNTVLFTGNVDARQQDVRIRSDEMTVYYTALDNAAGKTGKKASQQVQKIICNGNVEVSKKEWLGTSKKMIYLAKERQVVLLEDAKAYQGQNMVSGEKIIYYMDEGRSEVVGGKRTSATVGDTGKGDKKPSRVNMTIIQK